MQQIEHTLLDPLGLHARPAAQVAQCATRFASEITIRANGRQANAKRLIGLMTLELHPGDLLVVTAEGPDESEAIESLKSVLP